jgi:hypothetical protein
MKAIITLFLISIVITQLQAQSSKVEKLLTKGTWLIEEENEMIIPDEDLFKIVFKKDKTVEVSKFGSDEKSRGAWELGSDNKSLKCSMENYTMLEVEISAINAKSLKMMREGVISVFKNVSKNYKLPKKEYSKTLLGTWLLSNRDGINTEDLGELIQFNSDGTSFSNFKEVNAKWYSKKDFLIINFGFTEIVKYDISADGKKLIIQNQYANLELVKTDKKLIIDKNKFYDIKKDEIIEFGSYFTNDESPPFDEHMPKVDVNYNYKMSDFIGSWKVISIDESLMFERDLALILDSNGNYKVVENGIEERTGKWEMNDNKIMLYGKDQLETVYNASFSNDLLQLSDYNGILSLKRTQ